MSRVFLALGSNLGHRLNNLRKAVSMLQPHLKDAQFSIIIETEALLTEGAIADWNKPFLNMIVSGITHLRPHALLEVIKKIEHQIGRPMAHKRWEPRVIDIDILLWEGITMSDSQLCIPHLELYNRPFLLSLLAMMNAKHNNVHIDFSTVHYKTFSPIKSMVLYPQIVGIINVTPDSFSDGGNFFSPENAIKQAIQLIQDGASLIEIGGQSTRPDASTISWQEEWSRIAPVLEAVDSIEDCIIAIDTFYPEVVKMVSQFKGVKYINDVTSGRNLELLRSITEHQHKLIAMHSICVPPNSSKILEITQSPVEQLIHWIEDVQAKCDELGIPEVIIDPGIGFGKSSYQMFEILHNLGKLEPYIRDGVMIGHSRKSLFRCFAERPAIDRDVYSVSLGSALSNRHSVVGYLRVHNVLAQHMALVSTNF